MKKFVFGAIVIGGIAVIMAFFTTPEFVAIAPEYHDPGILTVPESTMVMKEEKREVRGNTDIEAQKSLEHAPLAVKGIYATSWSAGSQAKLSYFIDLIKRTELNSIVIDIKDFSGHVAYQTGIPEVEASGAEEEVRILRPNALIKTLHENGIYAIGRITVFQDPILARARPEWALQDKESGKTWTDRKGLAWLDPAAKEVWDYNIAIAQDALRRGFDEINFDYIRFESDGEIERVRYPRWDQRQSKQDVIQAFFEYARTQLPEAKISADIFGQVVINADDLGIGQHFESVIPYFDYVMPMTYPSHYIPGFLGYPNPAQYPYEIIAYSLESAITRMKNYDLRFMNNTSTSETATSVILNSKFINHKSKLRPWLQDFDLGATYDAEMVKKEIQAVHDAAARAPEWMNGWVLWSPSNNYTEEALIKE